MITVNSLSGGKTSGYMGIHYPADVNLFALVKIEDARCTPSDKKLVQMVSDKIGEQFIATAEDNRTLKVMFDLEQMIGKEIIWVHGPTYESLFRSKHFFGGIPTRLPSWARRYCTVELKIIPMFKYCFANFSEPINMNIGYRSDEPHRPKNYKKKRMDYIKMPIYCSLEGQKRQTWANYKWRSGQFPLMEDTITQFDVLRFWRDKPLDFPPQSNCVGCFHKDEASLNIQWKEAPNQMQWFADQEKIGKGYWLDNKISYERIKQMHFTMPINFSNAGISCQGGCTD